MGFTRRTAYRHMSSRKRARSVTTRSVTTPVTAAAAPPLRKIVLSGGQPMHAKMIAYWREGKMCDGCISAEGRDFDVHRTVVMVGSDFLEGAFGSGLAESDSAHVTLPEMSAVAVEASLNFLYTGECEVTEPELFTLLPAAAFLQIATLVAAVAAKIEERLTPRSCFEAWALADTHSLSSLAKAAKETALKQFETVASIDGFVGLPHARLLELLSDERLVTKSEEAIHEAVLRWARAQQPATDDASLLLLLKTVRYPLVSKEYFEQTVLNEPLLDGTALGSRLFGHVVASTAFGPKARQRVGFGPQRPAMIWSSELKGDDISLEEGGVVARAGQLCQVVISSQSLPATGKHLVELVFTRQGLPSGDCVGGCYMVGVVSAAAARDVDFDDRGLAHMAAGFWGVDDACPPKNTHNCGVRRGEGRVSAAPSEARCARDRGGSLRVFLVGDRLGLQVDMDARTLTMLRNGTPIPSLVFDNLPEQVHVAATLDDEDSKVRLVQVGH